MNLKTTFSLLILFIFGLTESTAQNINTNPYWKGEIYLADGTTKTGVVMVPNSSKENYIAYRPSEKGKKETVRRKEIKSIKVTSPNGTDYFYEQVPVVIAFNGKTSYGTSLLLVYKRNNLATFFIESGVYKVDPKTQEMFMLYRYAQGMDIPTVQYYIHKREEENTFILCMTASNMALLNSKLRKSASRHLTEDPVLLQKIMDGDLGHKDIDLIIDTYLESTKTL
jgi:hypothetical protein